MTRPGGGKHKGSAFEREVCKRLSLWVSGGQNEDLFWRSAMSGGRATVARKRGVKLNRQAGDICAVAPEGHSFTDWHYVETKHYKDLQIASFLLQDIGLLAKFWRETQRHAEQYNKFPILIAKQNFHPVLLIARSVSVASMPSPRLTATCGASVWLFDDVMGRYFILEGPADAEDTDNSRPALQ